LGAVFGLSFGELCVLLIVAMVVLGPKELPGYLRKAGQFAGRIRRPAYEMREKSGIDEVLRTEGLDREIAEFRRLARGEITGVAAAMRSVASAARIGEGAADPYVGVAPVVDVQPLLPPVIVPREREYPREGADSYGALPDTAVIDEASLPASPLAEDPLYARGENPTAPVIAPANVPAETGPVTSTTRA
jgi:sec-independent protein translocase protein TatB